MGRDFHFMTFFKNFRRTWGTTFLEITHLLGVFSIHVPAGIRVLPQHRLDLTLFLTGSLVNLSLTANMLPSAALHTHNKVA